MLDLIRREMPVDAYAFVLTDPETSVGVDPLATIPEVCDLPMLTAVKYTTATQRWTTLDDVVTLATTPPSARGPWHEFVLAHGVADVASMVLRDRYGCWGFVDLWSTGSGSYTDADLALLRDVVSMLTAAVRGCQASTFAGWAGEGTGPGDNAAQGPAVVLLDASPNRGLVITGATPGTQAWLTRLLPPDSGRAPVPAAVLNVAAQLLAREAGVDDSPPIARVQVDPGVWLRLRASRLDPSGQVAVTIELASPANRVRSATVLSGLALLGVCGVGPVRRPGMGCPPTADGKVVVLFQDSGKFNYRYSTLGFQDAATLSTATSGRCRMPSDSGAPRWRGRSSNW